ncbi:unnamed protein product [Acanthosepion pharaonis]|uniref:Transmembrane protein 26 n=1 Tax=Acanthosepion pharaonis TaxID=158019 RepID=A0A812CZC7_ACAPH|nr:unnamed protein product [Sepia pharaonis]
MIAYCSAMFTYLVSRTTWLMPNFININRTLPLFSFFVIFSLAFLISLFPNLSLSISLSLSLALSLLFICSVTFSLPSLHLIVESQHLLIHSVNQDNVDELASNELCVHVSEFIYFYSCSNSHRFSPSVFLYLAYTLPPLWLLELDLLKRRIEHRHTNGYLRATEVQNVAFLPGKIRLPISLDPEKWVRILQQVLLLLLIIGRWLLPKGRISREQLSQLLLIYIGMAADIIELFEAFKETAVMYSWDLTVVILSLWTASLLQFTFVVGTDKSQNNRSPVYVEEAGNQAITSSRNGMRDQKHAWSENVTDAEDSVLSSRRRHHRRCSTSGRCCHCCTADAVSILTSISLQDGPFLVLRMLLIFRYNVLSYTNIFFTSKNTLVILLQVYRLTVLYWERRHKKKVKRNNEENDQRRGVVAITKKGPVRASGGDSGQEKDEFGLHQSERKGHHGRKSNGCFCCTHQFNVDDLVKDLQYRKEEEEEEEDEEEIVIDKEDLCEELSESDMFEIVTCPSLKDSSMWEDFSCPPSTEFCSLKRVKSQQSDEKRRRIGHRNEGDVEPCQRHRYDCHSCKIESETPQKSNAEFRDKSQKLPISLQRQQKTNSWEISQKKKNKMNKEEEKNEKSRRFMKILKATLQDEQEVEPVRQLNQTSKSLTKSFRKDPKLKRPKLFQVAVEARRQSEQWETDFADKEGLKPDLNEMARCPNCANSENEPQYGRKRRRLPEGVVVCRIKEQMHNDFV